MNQTCPNCGYCPHCGRQDASPRIVPMTPYNPWVIPMTPYRPWDTSPNTAPNWQPYYITTAKATNGF